MTTEGAIAIACSLIGAATSVLMVIFMNRRQRNEVTFGFVPADKKEFDKHCERNEVEHKLIAEKLIEMKKDVDIHLSKRSETIFHRLEESNSSLRVEMRQQTDRRDEAMQKLRTDLEAKIEAINESVTETIRTMPNEIVALLRNTKGLM